MVPKGFRDREPSWSSSCCMVAEAMFGEETGTTPLVPTMGSCDAVLSGQGGDTGRWK